ncbi:MAG: glucose-6-phosphate dehydrogenase assembly protein OpcA [Chloroflexota bacterium]|nr:glucose-6-phosphate dehydrogenase assembly protein OpcA [Chloroflexota bacterium]
MAPNVTPTTPIEALTDTPVAVDPGAIESEFTRIWQETANTGIESSSVRLRLLNFIGVARSTSDLERFERVMAALPERHPCRGILAMVSPDAAEVTAAISAHCWRSPAGSRHVCSEEVLLRCGPGRERLLVSAVLALLVPELPVTAWLIGDVGLEDGMVTELLDSADRIFIDSTRASDPRAVMRAAVHAHEAHEIEVCDLAWCRLKSWRGLVAQFFDSAEGARELSELSAIEVWSDTARPTGETLLLAGWLVSRLGLSIADLKSAPGTIEGTLYDGSRGVKLTIAGRGDGGIPLQSVRLLTMNAAFLVEVHEASGHMHVREDWRDAPVRRTVAHLASDDASVFAEALTDDDDPKVFFAALQSALLLLGDQELTGSPARPS